MGIKAFWIYNMKGRPLTPVSSMGLTKSRETRAHIRPLWGIQSNMTPKWMDKHTYTKTQHVVYARLKLLSCGTHRSAEVIDLQISKNLGEPY